MYNIVDDSAGTECCTAEQVESTALTSYCKAWLITSASKRTYRAFSYQCVDLLNQFADWWCDCVAKPCNDRVCNSKQVTLMRRPHLDDADQINSTAATCREGSARPCIGGLSPKCRAMTRRALPGKVKLQEQTTWQFTPLLFLYPTLWTDTCSLTPLISESVTQRQPVHHGAS